MIICPSRNPSKHRETTCPLETPNMPTENSLNLIIVLPEACLPSLFQVSFQVEQLSKHLMVQDLSLALGPVSWYGSDYSN